LNKRAAIDEDTEAAHSQRSYEKGDGRHHQAERKEASVNGTKFAFNVLVAFRARFASTVMFPSLMSHVAISMLPQIAPSVS
jgi:hypothetical protein